MTVFQKILDYPAVLWESVQSCGGFHTEVGHLHSLPGSHSSQHFLLSPPGTTKPSTHHKEHTWTGAIGQPA